MDEKLLENRKNGAGAPKFNLKEAKMTSAIEEAINKVDAKDWYRAATCKSNAAADSMMRKITDERKKIGRAIALYYFGFETPEVLDSLKKSGVLQDWSERDEYSQHRGSKFQIDSYKMERDIKDKWRHASSEDDFNYEMPDFDEFLDRTEINDIRSIMEEEIKDLPSFKQAVEKNPEAFENKKFGNRVWHKNHLLSDYENQKKNLESSRDYYLNSFRAKTNFSGKVVFNYLPLDVAEDEINKDPELKEYIAGQFEQGSGFGRDSDHIVPAPVMDYLNYKQAIKQFFEEEFGIKLKMPQYFNSYNVSRLWEYADDDSAWRAGDLRNDPMFKYLVTVSRQGITFTDAGAHKMWYDFSKQIADAMGFTFNCKESF